MKRYLLAVCAVICAAGFSGCGSSDSGNEGTEAVYKEITMAPVSETSVSASEDTAASSDVSETELQAESKPLCADITSKILGSVEFPSMAEVGLDRVGFYLDCDFPEDCDFSMYICGSGGFADEICVINAEGMDEAALEAAVEKRIETRQKDFEGYNPDEYEKLVDYYAEYKNGYFIYAVTVDNDICADVFEEYVK